MKTISTGLVLALLSLTSCQNSNSRMNSDKSRAVASQESPGDRQSIEQIYQNWYTAWETKNYKLASQDYSDDAIWVNAFGMRRVGRKAIEETLKKVFAMDFVMAGKGQTVEKTVRMISATVAVVTSRVEREGQKMPSGKTMDTRKTSHQRVFAKSRGKWQIVSHLISDARSREKPEH